MFVARLEASARPATETQGLLTLGVADRRLGYVCWTHLRSKTADVRNDRKYIVSTKGVCMCACVGVGMLSGCMR